MKSFVNEGALASRCGSYTVMPIVDKKCLDLPFHIKRLQDSFLTLSGGILIDNDVVFSNTIKEVNKQLSKENTGYFLLSLTESLSGPIKCDSYFSLTPKFEWFSSSETNDNNSSFDVQFLPYKRKNPMCKDIFWPQERMILESNLLSPSIKEIIMYTNNNNDTSSKLLLEGLTSSFFCVNDYDNIIYTAPDTVVLPGSMRKLVLTACEQLGITVIYTCPNLDDIYTSLQNSKSNKQHYTGAFITSATKPIQTINTAYYQPISNLDYFKPKIRRFSPSPLIIRLRRYLIQQLQTSLYVADSTSSGTLWHSMN